MSSKFLAAIAQKKAVSIIVMNIFLIFRAILKKRIFGIMLDRIGDDEQLIFTTHNTRYSWIWNLPKT